MLHDEVAEWLRRWTANPLCSARVGSNPILVGTSVFICSQGKHRTFCLSVAAVCDIQPLLNDLTHFPQHHVLLVVSVRNLRTLSSHWPRGTVKEGLCLCCRHSWITKQPSSWSTIPSIPTGNDLRPCHLTPLNKHQSSND